MKKAVVSSFLAFSAISAMLAPGTFVNPGVAFAQAAAPASGQIQMDPKEYAAYDNAFNKETTPQTQAPALEAYLAAYPNSSVKQAALERIMVDYSQFDPAKALTAADNLLKVDPNSIRALLIETAFRRQNAEKLTDPAARQSALDDAASYATKGVAVTKPAAMSDSDFDTLMKAAAPTFYSAIGTAALNKKDTATAIDAFKKELAATPVAQTTQPGQALQDTYYLGQAYYQSTPPDLVNCAFYATRAYSYAPAQYQSQMPLAAYCYKKYHGGADGYDAVVTAAKANLNPPADFTIKAAPTAADQVKALLASTPDADLPKLAIDDKEYVIENGQPADADKVFDTIKGKTVEFPDVLVISATADAVQVAVSSGAVQDKKADFTFNMKTPLTKIPAAGDKVTLAGTYASYVQSPVMITMSDSEVVTKAAPKRAATTRRR
jgi:hypothetical protein